ncbi:TPA: hypothetical protein ACH3X2_006350 [Trebouxia sp. C0005]
MVTADMAHISPALQEYFKSDKVAAAQDHSAATDLETGADLDLGDLDITTAQISLAGVEDQLEHFANHDVLKAILDQGCDPKEYGQQYETKLRQAELESIQDYITESDNLVELHDQISSCDNILATMEDMLGKFQADLGNISTEIRALQEQSQTMSIKLKNRKGTEQKLSNFIESVAIPPALIDGILQTEVDETFHEHLLSLHRKLNFLEKNEAAQNSAAYKDVAPELEKLRVKAISKSRDYLMQRIYALRKPKTNIQILQQNVLLKYKYLVTFLRLHGGEVFGEVRTAYIDTLSRVLSSHFRAYLAAIERLKEDLASQTDVIGSADVVPTGMMALFQRAAAGGQDRQDVFVVGDRGSILHHLDQPAIIPHVAESENKKFSFELLFRSVNKLLMDTATSEYLFCSDFFQEAAVFHELFAPTLQVVESALAATLPETWDILCLLVMIRINYHHQLIMNKRRIPCLDDYLDRINLTLWPRFKALFDLQLGSIKHYNIGTFTPDVKVHHIVHRYAQLTASLLSLNADYQDGQLDHNLDRMRYACMDLLMQLPRTFKTKKLGTIFLINNFNHVAMVLREAQTRMQQAPPPPGSSSPQKEPGLGTTGTATRKEFEDQLMTCTSMYVEEQLLSQFGTLIGFVKRAEAAQKHKGGQAEGVPLPGYGPNEAAPVLQDFASRWQASIDALHKDTMKDFKNSPAGREVLKAAMTQLLLYYTRLLELLRRSGGDGIALARDAVTVQSIMYEIKRYNRT